LFILFQIACATSESAADFPQLIYEVLTLTTKSLPEFDDFIANPDTTLMPFIEI
jgi:hypothetical protein